jgi:RNA polymerase sigma-70 factor (ECF subfamily)
MANGDLQQVIYRELHQIASALFRGERGNHTLQPTALVHEAWLRLQSSREVAADDLEGQRRFVATAANVMRNILVDHARAHRSQKRGAGWARMDLDGELPIAQMDATVLLDLDAALLELAQRDERLAKVAELRIFGGLGSKEIADTLGLSVTTAKADWTVARAVLSKALSAPQ